MSKVMLVEDDNNLREIYEARLAAEGYEIVSAQDGEEALALAVKERPDLIIADIMMPKVSGFDMLDILRSTPETKSTKIIMMTALSQAEDKARAEKLGADKYLVKSQVTLEDVVKVAGEMLSENASTTKATDDNISATGAVVSQPSSTTPDTPTTASPPPAEPGAPAQDKPTEDSAGAPVVDDPTSSSTDTPPAVQPKADEPDDDTTKSDEPPTVLVTPAPDDDKPATSADEKQATTPETAPETDKKEGSAAKLSNTAAEEEAQITEQIEDFISKNPTLTTSAAPASEPKSVETKATSIPVTTPEDKADPATEADKTMSNAVDNLVNKPKEDKPEVKEDALPTDKEEPETAKEKVRKGGERIIQPLSDPAMAGPDINELLAKEGEGGEVSVPPANAVITPDGGSITPLPGDSSPASQGNAPGQVIAAPPSEDDPVHPNNIAL